MVQRGVDMVSKQVFGLSKPLNVKLSYDIIACFISSPIIIQIVLGYIRCLHLQCIMHAPTMQEQTMFLQGLFKYTFYKDKLYRCFSDDRTILDLIGASTRCIGYATNGITLMALIIMEAQCRHQYTDDSQ